MLRRIPTMCTDDAKIIALLNAFTPAIERHSWSLSSERQRQGLVMDGTYYRIGHGRAGVNVARSDWKRILAEHGIVMAEHWKSSYRGAGRPKIFNHCYIRSRFGETRVERNMRGGVRSCDNAEATAFYNAQQQAAVLAISASLHDEGLDAAKAVKKALQRSGDYI